MAGEIPKIPEFPPSHFKFELSPIMARRERRFIVSAAPIILSGLLSRMDGSNSRANIELAVDYAQKLYREIQSR